MHGRHAFTIDNRKLSLSVAPGGGFIGDIHLVSDAPKLNISPMQVPPYQTIGVTMRSRSGATRPNSPAAARSAAAEASRESAEGKR